MLDEFESVDQIEESRLKIEDTKTEEWSVNFSGFKRLLKPFMVARDKNEEIMKAFHAFNQEGSGTISFRDLKAISRELGENMTDEELQEMIDEADENGDSVLDFQEFKQIMLQTQLF